MPIIDHFRLVAPIYDRVITHVDPSLLRRLLDLPSAGLLLDVGGGTGRVSDALRDQVGEVVILDESPHMLMQARDKGYATVNAHGESLPFPDDSMDRILIVDALHHVTNAQAVLREFCRVLAPGGRLVIEEPDIERWQVKVLALAERLALMRSRFYTADALAQMMADCPVHAEIERSDHMYWVVVTKSAT